jgi:hypothetical protein
MHRFNGLLECNFNPSIGHRPIINLISNRSDGQIKIRLPFGTMAYNQVAGMYLAGSDLAGHSKRAIEHPGTAHFLRKIDVNHLDLWYLQKYYVQSDDPLLLQMPRV